MPEDAAVALAEGREGSSKGLEMPPPEAWTGPYAVPLQLATVFCELAMVFGGVVPYVPQYLAIKRSRNTKGFSLYVCLTLIIANTLRILFWFGKHFELPLLVQSVLMNLAMLELVRLCVNVNSRSCSDGLPTLIDSSGGGAAPPSGLMEGEKKTFLDFEASGFWRWTDFQSYMECSMCFLAAGSLAMYLLLDVAPFVETVGFLATFTEALLGTPQFYRNWRNGSTFGMSLQMVLMWTCGDLFKTSYFYIRQTPMQFVMCGGLQVGVDLAILLQVWYYRAGTAREKKKAGLHAHY